MRLVVLSVLAPFSARVGAFVFFVFYYYYLGKEGVVGMVSISEDPKFFLGGPGGPQRLDH